MPHMDKPSVTKMFDDLAGQDSDVMNFELKREPQANTTFSKDGLDDLMFAIQLFLGARLSHHLGKRAPGEPGPHRMSVEIKVGMDGEAWQVVPVEEAPWYATVDGARRGSAAADLQPPPDDEPPVTLRKGLH